MFYNLKITLRSLRQDPVYSMINIAGLSIGITISVLIFLWVYNERSFDRYHHDSERIYRITYKLGADKENPWVWSSYSYPFVEVAKNIPEMEGITIMRNSFDIEGVKVKDEVYEGGKNASYVDGSWFNFFDYQLADGSFASFGEQPFSVVLTKSEARKFFGNNRAVGQTIQLDGKDFMVQAVIGDNPSNSSFQQNILASADAFLTDSTNLADSKNWDYCNWVIYVKLSPEANIQEVYKKMNALIPKDDWNEKDELILRPLEDIHFETDVDNASIVHGNRKTVSIFTLLGFLLLFTACINYVNLTTAKANLRAKEVGIRKIIGGKRKSLFVQFIIESFAINLFSIFISLLLLWIISPLYHLLVENAAFSFSSPVLWIIFSAVLLLTTLLNGIYPALMLSSFKPMNILKGMSLPNMKDSSLRKGLVIFQFALSIILIVSVLVVYEQMQYIKTMNPGYNREQVFSVEVPFTSLFALGDKNAKSTMQTIKYEFQRNPNVSGVALSSGESIVDMTSSIGVKGSCSWEGRVDGYAPTANFMSADADFQHLLGLEMAKGRWFEEGNKSDEINFILNETAVREFKMSEPIIGKRFIWGKEGKIIGVVKDFHFKSLHEKISPLIVVNSMNYKVYVKTQPGKVTQSVDAARKIWTKFFPNSPFEYSFLDDSLNNLYKSDIRTSRLILTFSILTVLIALLGLFGLSTFAIERRTKEIGIRKILGASISAIIQLVTKEFLILVVIAFIIAAPLSWWAMSQWLENFAYRVNITVWIFVAAAILTLLIALIAMGSQAIKAATANPVKSIKVDS